MQISTRAEKLKQAIDHDDLSELQSLLSLDPDLRTAPIGYGGSSPLTWAAECRGIGQPTAARLAIAEWLIATGSDVHEHGDAPLMRASLDGSRTSMMALLVSHGADVNAAYRGTYPILFAPCEALAPEALAWLLDHGADPDCGTESAWQSRNLSHPGSALDYLLGTYLRDKDALNESIHLLQSAGGRTQYDELGVIDTIRGNVDAIRTLLHDDPTRVAAQYPSLNIGTTAGRMLTLKGATLLHVAAEFANLEVARLLLDAGADVNARALIDSNQIGGQTPIFHAATQNEDFGLEMTHLLIASGATLHHRCRLPGHYEHPEEIFTGTVLDYAHQFPGTENRITDLLRRTVGEQ